MDGCRCRVSPVTRCAAPDLHLKARVDNASCMIDGGQLYFYKFITTIVMSIVPPNLPTIQFSPGMLKEGGDYEIWINKLEEVYTASIFLFSMYSYSTKDSTHEDQSPH